MRPLPIQPLLDSVLSWWCNTGWSCWVGRAPTDEDLLFPSRDGKPWRPKSAERYREDLEAAGLPTLYAPTQKPFTFHKLRGTCSTHLSNAGVEGDLRSSLMGQAPKSVDDAHYSEKTSARLRRAIDPLVLPVTWEELVKSQSASSLEQATSSAPT
jgi:integrase